MTPTAVARGRRQTSARRRRNPSEPYILLLPALVLVGFFAAIPLVRSIWFAFNKISVFTGAMQFVGGRNIVHVLGDDFVPLLGRTAYWVVGAVTLQLLGGLVLALLLDTRFPLRGVYRGLVMVPWATPSVLVALMWKWLLDPNYGVINKVLLGAGLIQRPIEFLSLDATALPTLIAVDVWQGIPLFGVMILAALQGVSSDLKEAAATDGCGFWGTLRHVIMPAILPTILITALLRIIWTANYVDLIFILTGGGPGVSSTTLALQSYLTAYKSNDFGRGAAYAVIQAAILLVFVVIYLRLSGRREAGR